MSRYDELQQTHQRLLDRMSDLADEDAFRREVQDYVARVCEEAIDVPRPRERDQLRANLRYWASYLYDTTGTYPQTTLRPARSPVPEGAATSFRFTTIGLSVILMLFLILIGLIFLNRQEQWVIIETQNQTIQATNEALAELQNQSKRVTLEAQNVLIQETNEAVATWMAMPTETPVARPATTMTAASGADASIEKELQLQIDHQVVTQGPSPFDPTIWVIQVRLIGRGGNEHYIYWLNSQPLDDDIVIVQGARCEPHTVTIGVTSDDHAVKQDVTLRSPLRDCPTSR
ncbi:MAG TPA: hypothetical protein VLG46_09880 [Anaerolineae bacterium]|nr:hypothetical protein [Anaerolineae bacterium]